MAASNQPGGFPGRIGRFVLGVALWVLAGSAGSMEAREAALFKALDRFDAGDRSSGLELLHQVTTSYPDFRAARLIHASLLDTEDLRATLVALVPPTKPGLLEEPRDEAHARLSYWFDRPPHGYLPGVLVQAASDRSKVMVADTARSRLYLFEGSDADWTMRGDWYASIGRGGTAKRQEGDMKTPLGVYFVTMWVAGKWLPDLYGAGALGLNYPNGWDQRRQRDGYGIWIHGEPYGLESRPPRWSQGCLTISNPALETLVRALDEESIPVIIAEQLSWLAPSTHDSRRDRWLARIGSLNGRDNATRPLGIYGYPVGADEESTMILVEHHAERASDGRWWQYWRENGDGVWRVAHEGPASFHEIHFKGLPPWMPPDGLHRYAP